jgi:hypothetical protein
VEIDFSLPFGASQEIAWEEEYVKSVQEEQYFEPLADERQLLTDYGNRMERPARGDEWLDDPFFYSDRLEVAGERF